MNIQSYYELMIAQYKSESEAAIKKANEEFDALGIEFNNMFES